ncbi:PDZ and LIM domain protein 7-like [Tubulanus polymorphus]|uniref:PDZ and LIM domain protein 7-like n=1 Tax=Tubulanus polymorphus TaxID=672921 RepID=UPI003DA2167C
MAQEYQLRRNDSSASWGFRLNGGAEFGKPLYIQKITKNSIAHKAGLQPGDVLLRIARTQACGMSHEQAKMEIIRSGCDLDLLVQKNAMDIAAQPANVAPKQPEEESIHWEGTGEENKHLQSRSFRMLQMHLDESEATGERPPTILDQQD